MTLLCLLLFVGRWASRRSSALHTWLPDAMEGPTPVSALIHAATMVTAGVFMVCRLSPMFDTRPTAMHVVTWVGAATCFFPATIGTAQNDIKRVIAYSTCSQLGYMFFAAGVGAYGAAMFHLFTHAFFKALLFLGAGSVIHAMHHEQDMRYYGALRKQIPITFWVMVIGTLSITGVGVDGRRFRRFLVEGRDPRERRGRAARCPGTIAFWLGSIAALLTSFYSWRLIFLTFWAAALGRVETYPARDPRRSRSARRRAWRQRARAASRGERHRRLSPARKPADDAGADRLLAVGAVLAGQLFHAIFTDAERAPNSGAERRVQPALAKPRKIAVWVKLTPTIAMLVGLWIAWNNYIRDPGAAGRFVATFPCGVPVRRQQMVFRRALRLHLRTPGAVARPPVLARRRRGHDRPLRPPRRRLCGPRRQPHHLPLQSGYLYSYALVMLLGLIGAATWAIWWAR